MIPVSGAAMNLRVEQSRDHDDVRDVHPRAFGGHGRVVAELVDALRHDDRDRLSRVAEQADAAAPLGE